jgi:glycosyltransferase involved in cell wall biosynthesis
VRLLCGRLLGYRIVWTIHQIYPHERDSPSRDGAAARLLARLSDLLLAHDVATADAARAALPGAGRVHVVPHGSYIGVYPSGRDRASMRTALGLPQDAFAFLCFGELRGYKGVDLLLDAFRAADLPGSRLVVAGNPRDIGVAELVAREAAADPRIVPLLGFVREEGVAELFGACDAAVVTRRDGGTSGALLLAASLGLGPVVADLPPYRTLLEDDAAWFFTPGDPESLRAALVDAAGDRAAALARGRAAYVAATRVSWADIAARTATLLRGTDVSRLAGEPDVR